MTLYKQISSPFSFHIQVLTFKLQTSKFELYLPVKSEIQDTFTGLVKVE